MKEQSAGDVQVLIAAVAPRLARLRASLPIPLGDDGGDAEAAERASLLRRALQEWGVECRQVDGLTALEAFGIVSDRGREITVAADLPPGAQVLAYARCLVRLGLEEERSFATWFHYRDG